MLARKPPILGIVRTWPLGTNQGNLAFWQLIARLPRLRHLRIRRFGRGEKPNNLVLVARAVLSRLESLDMSGENDGADACHLRLFAGDLVHAATNIRHLSTSSHQINRLQVQE